MPNGGSLHRGFRADVGPRLPLLGIYLFLITVMSSNSTTKVVAYIRRSQDREDRQVETLEAQKRILTEYAKEHNLKIVHMYIESQSAYKTGRPEFSKMLSALEEENISTILSVHLTRIARNSYDGGRVIYMMDEGTIEQIITPDSTFTGTSDDKFMMQIHFAMAKKSSDDTSQFVKRDIKSKLLKGELPGTAPLGYLNIDKAGRITPAQYTPEKQQLLEAHGRHLKREEIDPLQGPLVARLFDLAGKGIHSLAHLTKEADQLGIRSRKGKKLHKSTVHSLLQHPYYCGLIRYQGELYDDEKIQELSGDPSVSIQHDHLIDHDLFKKVQHALRSKSKGRMRRHEYTFRGLMHCGECGCAITAETQKGHVYYHCTYKRGPCSQRKFCREENIEDQIFSKIQSLQIPQAFIEPALNLARNMHIEESKLIDTSRQQLQRQYTNCKQRLDGLLQLKISPSNVNGELLSDGEYIEQKSVLKKELENLEKSMTAKQDQGVQWIDDCETFFVALQKLPERIKSPLVSLEEKQEIVTLVCSNITLKNQKVALEYHEPFASIFTFSQNEQESLDRFERSQCLKVDDRLKIIDQSTNLACKWQARQDSNLRPSA